MQRHQAANERKADTQPALGPAVGARHLGEHVEHRREVFAVDADAVVAHTDEGGVARVAQPQLDGAAGIGVLRRVVEQVGEHLREPHGVAAHGQRLVAHLDVEAVLRRFDDRPAGLHRGGHDLRQIHRFVLHFDEPARDARYLEQIVHEPDQVTRLPLHHGDDHDTDNVIKARLPTPAELSARARRIANRDAHFIGAQQCLVRGGVLAPVQAHARERLLDKLLQ